MLASKPGSTRASATRRADQQRGADQQDQRQRDFGDDEHRARLVLPEAAARAPAAFLERRREIGARALERGNQAEQDARDERDGEREREHAPVDADQRAVLRRRAAARRC